LLIFRLLTLVAPIQYCAACPQLTLLAALLLTTPVSAQQALPLGRAPEPVELRESNVMQPVMRDNTTNKQPIVLRAQTLTAQPDRSAVAEGDVELQSGRMLIQSDKLQYDQLTDLATAYGHVRINHEGNLYSGPELQIKLQQFEGYFANPTYQFNKIGAGGSAQRVDFLDAQRATATKATYSSCQVNGIDEPAWQLAADKVKFDFAANEGVAEGGVLRFYGMPILAAPRLSFPLTDARKSGWLPPSIELDTKTGLRLSSPYYWNMAPNYDATFTPALSLRRGVSLDSEFRYLQADHNGEARINVMPHDRISGGARHSLDLTHNSDFDSDLQLQLRLLRASDNDYWKDFSRDLSSLTPRLLATDLQLSQPLGSRFGDKFSGWNTYVRLQRWQVLQTADLLSRIEAPYERTPQLGVRYQGRTDLNPGQTTGLPANLASGVDIGFEAEFNRFTNPHDASLTPRPTGLRAHVLTSISKPHTTPGWTLTPKVLLNAATYSLDAASLDTSNANRSGTKLSAHSSRLTPTFSLDSAWVFERETRFFGQAARQTLEPRLLYANTPYKDQSGLPNFDASAKDFNLDSIFSENAFSGVDRVSDAHQITAGVTTRVLDADTGAENLRLGVAQRYLLRDQLVTPNDQPLKQRYSDLLLLGSTTLIPAWSLEAAVQYSPENRRLTRSVVNARYSPGPFRTVSATYRLTRGLSEQVELGWQWPIYGQPPESGNQSNSNCRGTWYGVGRVNYSTLERRLIDSVAGLEYDAGCWVGRVVATRFSTGRSEATTRLSVQLELSGLSRLNLGANPLQVLKDNIPGYRLLRDGRAQPPTTFERP
jgi:LPS-assembly protein